MAAHMIDGNGQRGNRLRIAIWVVAGCLLLLPAVAMQFDSGVNWSGSDFLVMAVLLGTACGTYELGTRLSGDVAYRAGFGLAALGGFLMTWVNLAVGIIEDGGRGTNWLFFAVLGVGVAGALLARFRPRGMALALLATAIAQAALAVVAFAASLPGHPEGWMLSLFFSAWWLAVAALFRRAAAR
jgi:hypothetical protein